MGNVLDERYEEFHGVSRPQKKTIKPQNFTYRLFLTLISKYLAGRSEILDIGCGVGTISLYLASKGFKVLGIDISNNSVRICNESAKIVGLEKLSSFRVLNFPDELPNQTFDFILCLEVLEHIKEEKIALIKIYSLLRKDGVLLISVPSINAPLYRLGLTRKFDQEVGHLRRYKADEFIRSCRMVGFEIERVILTEGIFRNFLFVNKFASKFIRFIKGPIADFVTLIDNVCVKLFGESDIILVLRK